MRMSVVKMAPTKFLKFAALSLTMTLCIFTVKSNAQAQCGGFITSCKSPFEHSAGFLQATCRNDSGRWVVASINLDNYLSNANGNLVEGSGYSETCEGYGIIRSSTQFIVTASCKKFDGTLRKTGYDVNTRVSNEDGRLVFHEC